MSSVDELLYHELQFSKPHLAERFFELRSQDQRVGSVRFTKLTGTIAEIDFLGRQWSFKRMGFWHPYISIRRKGSMDDDLHLPFSNKWGGLLNYKRQDGQVLDLMNVSFWHQIWAWQKYDKTVMIEFQIMTGLKDRAKIIIKEIEDPDETVLLLALGCYALSSYGWDDDATGALAAAKT